MTDARTNWDALFSKAPRESAPSLDVASSVAQRIDWSSAPAVFDWATWSAAGFSVAAALMMLLTAAQTDVSWNDPLGDWFASLFLVMS